MGNEWREPHEHASEAGAPGASAPGEAGYEGEATVGDVGGSASPLEFQDPFGRPDSSPDLVVPDDPAGRSAS